MLKKVKEYVARWHMLEKGDKVIAGISGGADSVCLLFVLLELQKQIPFEIIVVHINHGLRGEDADADEAYVKALCEQNNIVCITYLENVELIAKNRRQSTEEAGRDIRREAFYRTMEEYGGTKIALAHHMNDNVETFFLNLARGTGLKGLGGIQPVAGEIIRPLLCLKRQEIEQFLEEREIPYCTDKSNASDAYTRNRLRNHVIPYMENEINSNTVTHIYETMEQLRDVQNFMDEQKERYLQECVEWQDDRCTVLEKKFQPVPAVLKPLILKAVLGKMAGREKDIAAVHLQTLQSLFQKQVGRKIHLPYEVLAGRNYEGIYLKKKKQVLEDTSEIVIPILQAGEKEQVILVGKQKITCKIIENTANNGTFPQKNNTKWFDYDIIRNGLIVRTRRSGDYITLDSGTSKKQKLKSYFINEKIPQEKRNKILLIAESKENENHKNENHILWIVGYRASCMYQPGRNTKRILEIKLEEQNKNEGTKVRNTK